MSVVFCVDCGTTSALRYHGGEVFRCSDPDECEENRLQAAAAAEAMDELEDSER